ncbi:MAG: Holliday junction resolvase [Thermoplasmatota archaeon]
MVTGNYERELRGVLSAEKDTLEGVTKTCSQKERDGYYSVLEIPFMVVRAGGSLGIDLIAIRGEVSFPIEVKSSKKDVLYFSDEERLVEQAGWIQKECSASKVLPLYAYRLKGIRGDKWRIFTMNIDGLSKKQKVLERKIPSLDKTSHGNYKMNWEEGMPLNQFISYLKYLIK